MKTLVCRAVLILFFASVANFSFGKPVAAADLVPLHTSGHSILQGNRPIRLRGIDWGWWQLNGTEYTEEDMRNEASWGANVARLCFSYGDLEQINAPGVWREDGFKRLGEVLIWAKKYGVYVILDMHVAPGGQDATPYTDGGRNRIWCDAAFQQNYLALWREIARRYRAHPEVAAYELMNEPNTQQPDDLALANLNKKAIAAVREVDPKKIIVVTGDRMSAASSLTDDIKVADPNILYTFHFYDGANDTWTGNLSDGPGTHGTSDWTRSVQRFMVPDGVSFLRIMLRSSNNSGAAWFDDVTLTDDFGKKLSHAAFGAGSENYNPERPPLDSMSYDPATGHGNAGSLKVSGTTSYNGWQSERISVTAGKTYVLSGWIKLENATGDTYLSAAFFANKLYPKDVLRQRLQPATAFGQKYNVPLWVGEFGCEASVKPSSEQARWVRDCISLFEDAGLNWTYWNFKETTSPAGMALQAERHDGTSYPVNQILLAALRQGWSKNAADTAHSAAGY